jgi:FkbM family methyltransferase
MNKSLFQLVPNSLLAVIINFHPKYLIRVKKFKDIFRVLDQDYMIFIARPKRLYKYKQGINFRINEMAKKYFVEQIEFENNDFIIDVGSNIGEFSLSVRRECALRGVLTINLIAIEADPLEFKCLNLNLISSDLKINSFVGEKEKLALAEFANDSGDTHIKTVDHPIINSDYRNLVTVTVKKLDNLVSFEHFSKIKLLKIETEGSEPEVLLGALKVLTRTKYVVLDTSPERGGISTFDMVNNILNHQNFSLIDNHENNVALYRNNNIL